MAFNKKYVPIPMISDNIGMPDVPILLPNNEKVIFCGQGDTFDKICKVPKSLAEIPQNILPAPSYTLTLGANQVQFLIEKQGGGWYRTLKYVVEPSVFDKDGWCKVTAWDSTYYNYSSYPLVVFFRCNTRRQEQILKPIKYNDEVGTIIPLQLKTYDAITFTTQPLNSDYARLLMEISEWNNVKFSYWESSAWVDLNVVKTAENWTKTTFPKTQGVQIGGSFVVKP